MESILQLFYAYGPTIATSLAALASLSALIIAIRSQSFSYRAEQPIFRTGFNKDDYYYRLNEETGYQIKQLGKVTEHLTDVSYKLNVRSSADDEIRSLVRSTSLITQELNSIKNRLNELQWSNSIKLDISEFQRSFRLPLQIYIEDKISYSDALAILSQIKEALILIGLSVDTEYEEEIGSWYKRLWLKITDTASKEEVEERLKKLERAAEVKLLNRPQADVNREEAEAVLKLMKSVEKVKNACIQIGNLILIKRTTKSGADVFIKKLTEEELRVIEKSPAKFRSSAELLALIHTRNTDPLQKDLNS